MFNRITALGLSIALCSSVTINPVVWAVAQQSAYGVPIIHTTISQNTSQIELSLGKAQIVRLSAPASRVSISNPEVVGLVMLSPTEVELIGKAIGVANLLVWGENSGQNYTSIDLSVHRDVSTLARKIQMIDPGINVLPVAAEDSVILTGMAETMEKAQLAYDLAKAFFSGKEVQQDAGISSNSPGSASTGNVSTKIINLIRVEGQPMTKADMVQEQLKAIDPHIKLDVVPGYGGKEKAILTGRVRNTSEVSKAVNLASVFYGTPGIKVLTGPGGNLVKEGKEATGGSFSARDSSGGGLIGNMAGNVLHGSIVTDTSGNVISMLEVEERPQVKCSIKFLEVRKDTGIDFTGAALAAGNTVKAATYAGSFGQSTVTGLFGQVNGANGAQVGYTSGRDFAAFLNGLITENKAKTLAEPTITSLSGEPSSFLAGGEFPIPVIGANGSVSVIFKEFGVRLNILPTVTERGTIHMQISPEVSSLDPTAGIKLNGLVVPGLRTRRSQTVLEMKNGDNFILSGLYNDTVNDLIGKTPLLGQLPIIGALFSSRQFQRSESEMVIVIHPEIQDQMNLSNVMPQSNTTAISQGDSVKQTIKLDPKTLYQQLQLAEKSMSKTQNKAIVEVTTPTSSTAKPQKDPQVMIQAMEKAVQPSTNPNAEVAVKASQNAPEKGNGPKPQPQSANSESGPVAMMAQSPALLSQAQDSTSALETQKTELAKLIQSLNESLPFEKPAQAQPTSEAPKKALPRVSKKPTVIKASLKANPIAPPVKKPSDTIKPKEAIKPKSEKPSDATKSAVKPKEAANPKSEKPKEASKLKSDKPKETAKTEKSSDAANKLKKTTKAAHKPSKAKVASQAKVHARAQAKKLAQSRLRDLQKQVVAQLLSWTGF